MRQTAEKEANNAIVRHCLTHSSSYEHLYWLIAISLNFTDTVEADGDRNREAVKPESKSGSRSQPNLDKGMGLEVSNRTILT